MARICCKRLFLQLIALQLVLCVFYLSSYSVKRGHNPVLISRNNSVSKLKNKWTIADKYTNYTVRRLKLKELAGGEHLSPEMGQVINDVTSFEYSINNEHLCDEFNKAATRNLLVLVVSATGNFKKRNMIRNTWARGLANSTHLGKQWARYSFLIGSSTPEGQQFINDERDIHNDLIQLKLPDDYSNLTLKSVALLQWVNKFCPQAHLVLKCDDDIFVNVYSLVSLVKEIKNFSSLYGNGMAGDQPKRQPDNKYFVSREVWPWATYPPYLFGGAYLIGRDAVRHLLASAQTTPYFIYEDVYLTGLCAIKANVNLLISKRMYERIFPSKLNPCFIRSTAMWQTQKLDQFVISQKEIDRIYSQDIQCTKLCNYLLIC